MSGVSGWGPKTPASTLRGKEGDIITKRQQGRVTLGMGWVNVMLDVDVRVRVREGEHEG